MSKIVSKAIFGCAKLGLVDMGNVCLSEVKRAASKAIEYGVTTFDCADIYGLGAAEKNLTDALGKKIKDVHIISKFGIGWRTRHNARARTYRDISPDYMRVALDASLKRLKVEKIDTYFIHWPDGQVPIKEISGALEAEKKAGKIGAYGFSNFANDEVFRAVIDGDASPTWVQTHCSLLSEQNHMIQLKQLREIGIKVMVYGTLAQGYLTGKFAYPPVFSGNDRRARLSHFSPENFKRNARLLEILGEISDQLNLSKAQIATAWCIENGLADSAIVGIKSEMQLSEAAHACNGPHLGIYLNTLNAIQKSLIKDGTNDYTQHG